MHDIAELVFHRGDRQVLRLRIDRAELCIGSNPTNDVVLPDASVPEVAALLIDRGAERFRIRDLTQGKLVLNGAPLEGEEADLSTGDAIAIGPYVLSLEVRSAGERQRHGHTNVLDVGQGRARTAILIHQGKRFQISPSRPFNIGGHDDNDLVISDPFVSAFHCRISNRGGRWFLADLDSTNGTEVNGLGVRDAELPIPATVRIGKAVVSFELDEEARNGEEAIASARFHGMIGTSAAMRRVFGLVSRLAHATEPVLVIGESGSGKELIARALHEESSRRAGPYLALNCGALTSTLIEAELFGHVKGAFTGAVADKAGAFEAASGGTLFLDEIGELPLELQPKLLRVLESSTVRRVGGTKELPIDTRIVAATHRNLEQLVREGSFREDLFHRLFVLSIRIPPLAERPDDIIPLAEHVLSSQATRPLELGDDAKRALLDYTWPGNVRELRNVIVRAILMTDGSAIRGSDLQFSQDAFTVRSRDARASVRRQDETERQKVEEILERTGGNRAEAARLLGLSKSTFHDRLKRFGIPLKFGVKE